MYTKYDSTALFLLGPFYWVILHKKLAFYWVNKAYVNNYISASIH